MHPASAWSSTNGRSPTIPMSPTPSPVCGTAIGRRTSPRSAEITGIGKPESGFDIGNWKPVSGIWNKVVPVRVFRVALTGDFLGESGAVAYGDIGLGRLGSRPYVRWHFVTELAPKPDDPAY